MIKFTAEKKILNWSGVYKLKNTIFALTHDRRESKGFLATTIFSLDSAKT